MEKRNINNKNNVNNTNNIKKENKNTVNINKSNKKNNNSNSNNNNKNKKYSVNYKKLGLFVILVLLVFLLVYVIFFSKEKINDNTDISNLDASKYQNELKTRYEGTDSKERFLKEYDVLQTSVATYLMDNMTTDENSFDELYEKINKDLEAGNYTEIESEKLTNWNGSWSIDENGVLKFKFASKDIEPSWVNDEEVKSKIILN